jgi:hypothetical protein
LVESLYDYRYNSIKELREEIDIVLNLFDTDYVDSILLLPTAFSRFGEKEVFDFFRKTL